MVADRKYPCIVADPPWEIAKRIGVGGRRRNETVVPYPMMKLEEIKALPVREWAAPKAHLYLWSTRRLFREGTAATVARAWGFEPVGEIIWGLRNAGTGGGTLTNDHEPILVCSRGGATFPKGEPCGVWFWKQPYVKHSSGVPMKEHSAKPPALQDLVERLSPGPYLELFARKQRLGWSTWGNEALNHLEVVAQ